MKLSHQPNIGKEMERKLISIGIYTPNQLKSVGSKEAFRRLKLTYPRVCLVHLYALQGAVDHLDMALLPPHIKEDLKAFSDGLK